MADPDRGAAMRAAGGDAVLTEAEHRAMDRTAELWNALCGIADDGPARDGDLAEMCSHIHAIQRAILAQAAARAYPDRYRLMGGHPVSAPVHESA